MEIQEAYLPSRDNSEKNILRLSTRHPRSGKKSFTDHRHLEFQISYIKSGSGTYQIEDTTYYVRPGDLFFFRSNDLHWLPEIDFGEPMTIVELFFDPRLLWPSNNEFFNPGLLRLFVDKSESFCHRLEKDHPMWSQIQPLFQNIENEFVNRDAEYPLLIKLNLLTMLVLLQRHFGMDGELDTSPLCYSNFDAIEKSMDYLHEHLTEDLTLSSLAQIANMSETYYSSVFKKLNGISPWGYISAKRIDLAKHYLTENTAGTMLELALRCGFKNTANFNRTFKKHTGKTPSEYRSRQSSHIL